MPVGLLMGLLQLYTGVVAALPTHDGALAMPRRTYFVSSTAGSDDNSGASATEPLATVEKAARSLQPGDSMLLRRGDA